MHTLWSGKSLPYLGSNLRSSWIEETFGLRPPALVAWVGPCHVTTDMLVDLEDAAAGAEIRAASMLHFLAEHPSEDLLTTVLRQRLLVCLAHGLILSEQPQLDLRREGDDLWLGNRKLSVSIATRSPRSGLIHLGLNVDPTGAPVPAVGLEELGLAPQPLATRLLAAYREEMLSSQTACGKVREVD